MKIPTPKEFKEIWQPKAWARNIKRADKNLENLLRFIADKLRNGETTLGGDCVTGVSRSDLDNALAARGWKLRKMATSGPIPFYELVPLDSETTEEPPF